MAQSTALAFDIGCIAAKGAKTASCSVSSLKPGASWRHKPARQQEPLRGDPTLLPWLKRVGQRTASWAVYVTISPKTDIRKQTL